MLQCVILSCINHYGFSQFRQWCIQVCTYKCTHTHFWGYTIQQVKRYIHRFRELIWFCPPPPPPPAPPTHTHSNYWTSTVRSIMKQWQRSPVKKENTGKQKYGSLFRIHGVAKFLLHLMTVSKRGLSLWCCLTNGSRSFCRIWACPSWRLMSHVSSSRRRNRISSFTVSAHEK